MASAKDVLGVAYSQLGYHAPSDPEPGSKCGRWLAALWGEEWLAGPSDQVWWCCLFVSWCLDQAGQDCPGFPTYNTDLAIANGASSRLVDPYDAEPGDVLIFDWNWANEATDHIGFCVENHGNGWLETIEGNVGNAVAEKTRDVALVRYCVRPWYDGSGTLPATGLMREDNPDPGELEIDDILGNLSVTKWQRELSTGTYDCVVSGQWVGCQPSIPNLVSVTWEGDGCSLVAQAIQRKVGAEVDGLIGPKTVRCLQRWLTER